MHSLDMASGPRNFLYEVVKIIRSFVYVGSNNSSHPSSSLPPE